MSLSTEVRSGVYRHYRGANYLVLGVARLDATEEAAVVYIRLYGREGIPMSVRTLDDFFAPIELDGTVVPRFEYVGLREETERA